MRLTLVVACLCWFMNALWCQTDTTWQLTMPQIEIATQKEGLLRGIPGSVCMIKRAELAKVAPISANEVLRRVPGLHVVDEEGAGMRVNVGIRGLNPDRSRNVLVLEDGIPVALNPYGEPEMYYSPVIDRMSGVEVLKGSGQILFGPQTTGGVINYITANPPDEPEGRIKMVVGQQGYVSALASYGATIDRVGVQTTLLHKRTDQLGYVSFRLNDFATKLRFSLNKRANVGIKLGFYDETSDATYIGLTQSMYEAGDQDFVRMAPDDFLAVRRYSASVTHQYRPSARFKISTTAYGYTTTRNWQRQDFSSSATASNRTGVVWGNPALAGSAVYMQNQNAHRNRQFEVAGVEPRVQYDYALAGRNATLEGGIRYLYERAFEQRLNGTKANALSGALVEDEVRTGHAFSAFAQQKWQLAQRFALTGGLRMEVYDYERHLLRNTFTVNGRTAVMDTSIRASNTVHAFIPGIGFNYNLYENATLFGGLHKGFAPPRVKDAISTQGAVYQLEPENSWNAELGLRGQHAEWLRYEFTAFYLDFSNQIIPVSLSSGGAGVGLVNGGRTLHRGIEVGYVWELGKMLGWEHWQWTWQANATWLSATFNETRLVENINIDGNRTPYAPDYTVNASLHAEWKQRIGMQLTGAFVGAQFGDEVNTLTPAANGRTGKLPNYHVWDANAYFKTKRCHFNLSIKNLTNERYIASRRPQGIRVGLPRFVSAGVEWRF